MHRSIALLAVALAAGQALATPSIWCIIPGLCASNATSSSIPNSLDLAASDLNVSASAFDSSSELSPSSSDSGGLAVTVTDLVTVAAATETEIVGEAVETIFIEEIQYVTVAEETETVTVAVETVTVDGNSSPTEGL